MAEQSETAPTKEAAAAQSPNAEEAAPKEPDTPAITFQEFRKVDLRVAQVLAAERIEKSNKLVKLQITLGAKLGERQIVAGIAKHYTPDELVGRKIVVVANLAPAKLMGEESRGMLLAASEGQTLALLQVDPELPPGAAVS